MSEAFRLAERARRHKRPPSPRQRRYLSSLAAKAGIEEPRVAWSDQATEAITRLEHHLRQPALPVGV